MTDITEVAGVPW